MSKNRSSRRAVAIAATFVFATFFGLALAGVAQIFSLHEWCESDAVKQMRAGADSTVELQLDSTPAVLCHNGSATLELPISPAVATIVFAVVGMAISMFVVVRTARDARTAA
ncbi:hypothetical protein ACIRG5_47510 [Lentzea sp. NPDC102401]|uniref:hypothetical protein n=1 Tax=Lentzea sp. NPDC102401 TaxID=3364128 RepID=UPI0038166258